MSFLIQWFRKKVRWLEIGSDVMDTDFLPFNVIPEMVKFDIEMLRSRSILVDASHFQCSAIVLEFTAVNSGLRCRYWVPSLLHLLQQLHYGDRISKGVT